MRNVGRHSRPLSSAFVPNRPARDKGPETDISPCLCWCDFLIPRQHESVSGPPQTNQGSSDMHNRMLHGSPHTGKPLSRGLTSFITACLSPRHVDPSFSSKLPAQAHWTPFVFSWTPSAIPRRTCIRTSPAALLQGILAPKVPTLRCEALRAKAYLAFAISPV